MFPHKTSEDRSWQHDSLMLMKSLTTIMMICSSQNFTICICPKMRFFTDVLGITPTRANVTCP
uniref:Uncharacterized protein n=1 Tax=Arundo donax TaxID=35708 RepID=A0A0A9AR85_ARUDO